jgi:hypothetical protein
MSITHCKPQQQTLSILVSESLRQFLELAKEFITNGRVEAVSISDLAKLLLESAKEDRLNFRLEAAELQPSPNVCARAGPKEMGAATALSRASSLNTCRSPAKNCRQAENSRLRLVQRGARSTPRRARPPN